MVLEFNRIKIIEGFFAHEYTNILPVKKDPENKIGIRRKEEDQISIAYYNLHGYLGKLLFDSFEKEVQIEPGPFEGYDEYGWNYYTPLQIRSILTALKEFVQVVGSDPFDSRFVEYLTPGKTYIESEGLSDDAVREDIRKRGEVIVDFYTRFISRMERMLDNMEGYDLIEFMGP